MLASEMVAALQRKIAQHGDGDVTIVVENVTRDKVKGGQVNVDTYNVDVDYDEGTFILGDAADD